MKALISVLVLAVFTVSAHAENYTTNIVSGVATNIDNQYIIGNNGVGNYLEVRDGGSVTNIEGIIGDGIPATNNAVLVTGPTSTWYNSGDLYVGRTPLRPSTPNFNNSLTIADGGRVQSTYCYIGYAFSISNTVVVTGTNSILDNTMDVYVGYTGSCNQVMIKNGACISCRNASVGSFLGFGESAVVAGLGSSWLLSGNLNVGWYGSNSNRLDILDGGSVVCSGFGVGQEYLSGHLHAVGNILAVSNGTLFVTNATHTSVAQIGPGGAGTIDFSGGRIICDKLVFSPSCIFYFNDGLLDTRGTTVSNSLPFIVGNGVNSANFHLSGGTHSFVDSLLISSNAWLTGCGTIKGTVTNQGTILLDCSTVFSNAVVNSSTMIVTNGATVDFYGPVSNDGIINTIYGAANFHAGVTGTGVSLDHDGDPDGDGFTNWQEDQAGTSPLDASSALRIFQIIPVENSSGFTVSWQSVPGKTYKVLYTDSLAASWLEDLPNSQITATNGQTNLSYTDSTTNSCTNRFYRIRLVLP
jgi:T5SS/PEP-CTERM-associated repeat protein